MKNLWLSVLCIVLLLSGCLDAERFSLSLDLKGNTAQIGYSNIVSDSKEEAGIRGDFEELLKKAHGEDQAGKAGKFVSANLYEKDGRLDGVAGYSFRDNAEMLKEYEITRDEKGDFIFDLSKESNLEYAGGNGAYVEEGKKRFVRWDRNSASLVIELKNKAFDAKSRGLLSYWLGWKKQGQR